MLISPRSVVLLCAWVPPYGTLQQRGEDACPCNRTPAELDTVRRPWSEGRKQ